MKARVTSLKAATCSYSLCLLKISQCTVFYKFCICVIMCVHVHHWPPGVGAALLVEASETWFPGTEKRGVRWGSAEAAIRNTLPLESERERAAWQRTYTPQIWCKHFHSLYRTTLRSFLLFLVQLTVEITAQQLQPESGPLHNAVRVDPDVTCHEWRGEEVLFYFGAVQVAMKDLQQNHFLDHTWQDGMF